MYEKKSFALDDVVILYYSGHGQRQSTSPLSLPGGNIENEETGEDYVALEQVVKKLLSKKVALCVVLFDCCNVLPNHSKSLPFMNRSPSHELSKLNKEQVEKNFKQLLEKPYGFIVAAATSPRELGWCLRFDENIKDHCCIPIVSRGAVFTTVFLNNFFEELQAPDARWKNIFAKTKNACVKITMQPNRYLVDDETKIYCNPPHKHQTPQAKFFLYEQRQGRGRYIKHLFKEFSVNKEKQLLPKDILIDSSDPDLESNFDMSSVLLRLGKGVTTQTN